MSSESSVVTIRCCISAKLSPADLRLLWVNDWYDGTYYARSPAVDPEGPSTGELHTPRGASWNCDREIVRSAFRGNHGLGPSSYLTGFRVARDLR